MRWGDPGVALRRYLRARESSSRVNLDPFVRALLRAGFLAGWRAAFRAAVVSDAERRAYADALRHVSRERDVWELAATKLAARVVELAIGDDLPPSA